MKNHKATVSFIIPHHGRDPLLIQTIESVLNQDVSEIDIEVIVVTKAELDDAHPLSLQLQNIGMKDFIRFLTIPHDKTISFGRNHGAAQSKGDYLAFIDADVQLASNWVTSMITVLESRPEVILASAVQVHDKDNNTIDIIKSSMSEANLGEVNALPGNALFISRTAFNTSAKFPENLETCEDWVFTNGLTQSGKLALTNTSSFVHLGEDKSYSALFNKEIWRGKSNFSSLPGRTIGLKEFPSFIVPLVVFSGPILALVAAISKLESLAILTLMATLLAPLLYSVRLKIKSKVAANLGKLMMFYWVYFNARAIGMIKGLVESKTGYANQPH